MHSYIHSSFIETARYFMDHSITHKDLNNLLKQGDPLRFFKHLENNYKALLTFCCQNKIHHLNALHANTSYTYGAIIKTNSKTWHFESIESQQIQNPDLEQHIQKYTQQLIEDKKLTRACTGQTFVFELKGEPFQTYIFGVHYKGTNNQHVFYVFNYVNKFLKPTERVKNIHYQKSLSYCQDILIQLIKSKRNKIYSGMEPFVISHNISKIEMDREFENSFKKSVIQQYQHQRALFALELFLYSKLSLNQISKFCFYRDSKVVRAMLEIHTANALNMISLINNQPDTV